MASSVRVTTRRVHYRLDKVQGQRFCFQLEWSKESNSSWRSTGEVCRRTCSAWPWDQQEGKKKFQDRMQLVSKCNCYTHLLHKCCKSQSVQLCSPKFSEQIRKKAKKKPCWWSHFKALLCSMFVLLGWDKMTVGGFGAQCARCRAAGDGLRWSRPCDRTRYPAGRSRWMRCGHKQMDMISNNTQARVFKLSSTVTAPAITDSWHVHVLCCLHGIVTLHMSQNKSHLNRRDTPRELI